MRALVIRALCALTLAMLAHAARAQDTYLAIGPAQSPKSIAGPANPFPFFVPPGFSIPTTPGAGTSQALAYTTVTSGTAVTVLGPSTPNAHGKGGWIKNCNASGTMFVNDNGTATTTEGGSNAALIPGLLGAGQLYTVPAGVQNISVNASAGTLNICGEGLN